MDHRNNNNQYDFSRNRDRDSKGCHECGRDGHVAKYCPKKGSGDDRGDKSDYRIRSNDERGDKDSYRKRSYDRGDRDVRKRSNERGDREGYRPKFREEGGMRPFSKDCYNC